MKAIAAAAAVILLSACASKPQIKIQIQEKDIPVPTACVAQSFPAAPGSIPTSAELAALPDGPARYQALQTFYFAFGPWIGLAQSTIAECQRIPAPTK